MSAEEARELLRRETAALGAAGLSGLSMDGTDSVVPLSSPRSVPVESPRTNGLNGTVNKEDATAAALQLLAARAAVEAWNAAEQDSVHHALYNTVGATRAPEPTDANAVQVSSPSGTATSTVSNPPTQLFTPSTNARVSLSVRASNLPSASWLGESTTLAALFQLDDSATHFDTGAVGGAGASHGSTYMFKAQTEVVASTNNPVYKSQFQLDRSVNPRIRRARANYTIRLYDAESETIDDSSYLGLAMFNLEELLQNCRSQTGGNMVSVTLPLLHPEDHKLAEALLTNEASITISFQVPFDSSPSSSSSSSSSNSIGQSSFLYTRLVNFISPNIMAGYFNLSIDIGGGSNSKQVPLLTAWYRPRATGLFQLLALMDLVSGAGDNLSSASTLVVSDEVLTQEIAAEGLDEAEAGFQLRFVLLDRARLLDLLSLGPDGLAASRALQKTLRPFLESAATPKATGANAQQKPSPFMGGASVTFKTLLNATDSNEGINIALGGWAGDEAAGGVKIAERPMRLRVTTRAALAAPSDDDSSNGVASSGLAALPVPSLPSAVPSTVLGKAHRMLQSGVYFSAYTSSGGSSSARNIFMQLVANSGAPRLVWRDAAPADGVDPAASAASMDLAAIDHIYGGTESSAAFEAALSVRGTLPPSDCLFTISAGGQSLSLESTSVQFRDTFLFALLSFQLQALGRMASWHPASLSASAAASKQPRIVKVDKPQPADSTRAQLGGSHGSLKRSLKPASTPASPAPTAKPSAEQVDLNEVLNKLEKLFEGGRNFIRFTSGAHKPFYIALFLRKDPKILTPQGRPLLWLHWCKADARNISATRAIRCDEIHSIVLGKQSSVFKKDEAALAPNSHCFSIIANTQSLHLQSWNERDSDTYAFGIASLLKSNIPRPKLYQSGQYAELGSRMKIENSMETLEEMDEGTIQVNPEDIPTLANAQGFKCSVELSIKCRNLPSKPTPYGNHIVCVFDRDESTEKLIYLAQSEKSPKPINPDFRKNFKLNYDSTMNMRKLRFNVYDLTTTSKNMDEEDRIGSCMMILKEVVDGAGIESEQQQQHNTHTRTKD